MNVHICWLYPNGDKIIDRLMRMLADGAGWSIDERPRGGVDLNYFGLYIDYAQRFTDWRKTPLAAYFSHLEPNTPYKKFWWEVADPLINIKTVTADCYGRILSGEIVKVTVPIDPNEFTIREHKATKLPRIGISGFVDQSGRKGEALLARLAGDLEGRAEFVASGVGWPVRIISQGADKLNDFYARIDVYVCTSLIEGVPMTPLEALACGRPVIIPVGVGMLDEIPDIPGVYRYAAGDYKALLHATKLAIEQHKEADREALRKIITGRYTPEAWVESHVKGFEKALKIERQERKEARTSASVSTDRHGQRGVYYVAYGDPARTCARAAIDSFKRHLPGIPVALVSDKPLGPEDVFIHHDDTDIGGRAAKVKIYDLAPKDWTYICYLDADTEIIAAEQLLWHIVEDGWDMVICKNPARFHVASQMKRSDNVDECELTFSQIGTDQVIQLNGGVFAFQRNERTRNFFHGWHQEWLKWGKRDQAALLRSLWKNPIRLWVLGNEWNTITRYEKPDVAAWLLHYPMTARRWRGVVHHRLDDPGAWDAVREFERSQK